MPQHGSPPSNSDDRHIDEAVREENTKSHPEEVIASQDTNNGSGNAESLPSPTSIPQPKVRFSLDATRDGRSVASSAVLPRAATWNHEQQATTRTSPVVGSQQHSQQTSPSSPVRTSTRNRNRGYSLRRSLFAQNLVGKENVDHGLAIEMESAASSSQHSSSSSPTASPSNDKKNGKGSPTVTVEEEEDVEENLPVNPVRLSDPAFNLPLYTKWAKNQQRQSTHLLRSLHQKYYDLQNRLFRVKPLPPSANGRHVRVNPDKSFLPIDERTSKAYITNNIRSCRYTPLNFVPRQLWAQFGKLANFYFLCVSLLQMVPGLSTTGTYTTIIPLLIFVCISMAKEGYDDIRRYRLDKEENERKIPILTPQPYNQGHISERKISNDSDGHSVDMNQWRSEKWEDLKVGDVVLLQRDCAVPADIVLLRSSDPTGAAYIETKSLDGETNLKSKKPIPQVAELCKDEASTSKLDAQFVVEDPNLDLYRFDGKVSMNGTALPLTNNEVVYRGSILRNTRYVFGLVIYSGEECKIRMNANKNPRVKAPALQAKVNRVVIIVASLVFFIAIIMTIANSIWVKDFQDHAWYLKAASVPFGHILTSFIIMFNTMLPLSLYVSLEIVKLAQIYFMNDVDMYDPESDTPMESRTSTINEELGQVSYIFSDKTGTLTNNSMRFRKMSIAGTAWLHDFDLQEEAARADGRKLLHKKRNLSEKRKEKLRKSSVSAVAMSKRPSEPTDEWRPPTKIGASLQCGKTEELLEYIQHRPQSVFARKARFFILGLALCHSCVPEKDDDGNITFQAESPDELALVTAAQDLGYIVSDRHSNSITVKTFPNGEDQSPLYERFEVLDVIEFSSVRKRMSIIIRLPDSRICVFTKGADTTIRKLLRLRDVAESNAANVERRASIRKSLEVSEALRRQSVQSAWENPRRSIGTIPRRSIGANPVPLMMGRKSSVSIVHGNNVRASIDAWLTERERDVDVSMPRHSSTFYTPRPSVQMGSSLDPNIRISLTGDDSPRQSFQTDDINVVIDENIVLNDNAVFERCFQHIDDFATEGLRTLLYGFRYLPEDEYRQWKEKFDAATTSLVDRQEKIEEVGDLIENQFELLGATAIEDKLQDGVPDAIERFRRAGIKMWMLTGDKRETAINIGHSCRLIKDYSTTVILDHELGDLPSRMATAVADINNKRTAHSVLVVDGQTLTVIDLDSASKALFADLAIASDSVICCRASPSQKAGLVKTIRLKVKGSVTLAIGDGANDIAMIQEAHVGIGIAGKEGLQAARTSDYSIAQFRFLLKLLLVHGRWNYVRVCKYTLGTFWKEMVFYIVQALYQRWTGYTGTSLYEPWSLSMFNTLFTSLPVIFMGVFEKDLAAPTLLAVPELYSIGRLNQGFNIWVYFRWALLGTMESLVVYFTMYSIYGEASFTADQRLYAMGSLAFTACVILISLKLQCFELHNKSITSCIAIFLSLGGWWLWNLLLTALYPETNAVYNVHHGLLRRFGKNPLWWLTLILIIVGVSMLEILIKGIKMVTKPNDTELFQAYERDLAVKKRFEESAADLLQQGWNRGTKKSSLEIAREEALEEERAAIEAQREAEIEAILNRPRTMHGGVPTEPDLGVRRRHSAPIDGAVMISEPVSPSVIPRELQQQQDDSITPIPKKSMDIGEFFKAGFGTVRKGSMGVKFDDVKK